MKVLVFKDIKHNRWTLWTLDRRRHLGYRKTLALKSAEFVVVENKRKQVLKSGKRFPHAWVIGELTSRVTLSREVRYNPFTMKSFQRGRTPVKKAALALFTLSGKVFV